MALSIVEFQNRIRDELSLLGSFADIQDNLIKDALIKFCRFVEPEISAVLVIVAGTSEYSIPDTIEKITGILDSLGVRVVAALNEYERKIVVSDSTSSGNATIFGTPRNIRTNFVEVIAGMNENYSDVLWNYIVWAVHRQACSEEAISMLQYAEKSAKELRQDRNNNPDTYKQTVQQRDRQGNIIDDLYNVDGIIPEITDFLKADL